MNTTEIINLVTNILSLVAQALLAWRVIQNHNETLAAIVADFKREGYEVRISPLPSPIVTRRHEEGIISEEHP